MTDEIQTAIREKRYELVKLDKELEEYSNRNTKRMLQLDDDYERTRKAYEQMDKEAEAERQKKNEEYIAAATEHREQKIAALQKNYEDNKEQLKINF